MSIPTDPYSSGIATLDEDGAVPASRISDAEATRNMVLQWLWNDNQGRAQKRALLSGLVQGNPPYRRSVMVAEGRGDGCNVNWRTAEAYEDTAVGALYDLFSEAPTFTTVSLLGRDADTATEWSHVVTEEFDILQKADLSWDATMQCSIRETVRFAAGPLIFLDDVDFHVRQVPFEYLVLPDDASSDINRWEVAAVRDDMLPHQLYDYIRNASAASDVGWDVEATKQAIINAAPKLNNSPSVALSWEWIQQQLKQNSYSFSARSKVIQCCHIFAREFPRKGERRGKITHAIFVLSVQAGNSTTDATTTSFLYRRDRLYDHWQECIHPMYYAQGQGGKHYGVTGQGIKMYGAMEAQNRLLCNAFDKAFAPKIMFKAATPSGKQRGLPTRRGDYQVLPDGWSMEQVATGSMIEDQIVMNREISGLVSANLSSYRQNLDAPKSGNPITAEEVQVRAADQSRMGKTQINRYYEQLDWLYEERYRRACNTKLTEGDPGGEEALEFQRRCEERGVPRKELSRICSVKATRVTGQGSQQMRKQALQETFPIIGRLPEDGQESLIRDYIASTSGQYMVDRYYPKSKVSRMVQDQLVGATLQVASMKDGIAAIMSPSQNPLIYAQTFIQASSQALASLSQGTPQGMLEQASNVVAFLDLSGPAIAMHLKRMSGDATRKEAAATLEKQFQDIGSQTDQLKAKVKEAHQKKADEQQALEQQQAEAQSKSQIDMMKAQNQGQIKQQNAALTGKIKLDKAALDRQVTLQKAGLADATTAAKIHLDTAKTAAELIQEKAEHRQAMRHAEEEHNKPAPKSKA